MGNKNQTNLGIFYGLFAFTFWGLVPIYFKAVSSVPALEVLIHRVIWSVVFLFFIIWQKKEFFKVLQILNHKKTSILLFIASIVIAINWLTFIWAVSNNQISQASLGYYMNPLLTILFGHIFLKESVNTNQKIAIFLCFLAICFQLYAMGYFPMVSLILAITFPIYSLLRKKLHVNSLVGLFIETAFMFPFAFIYFIYLSYIDENHFSYTSDANLFFLLMLGGAVTIIPLLAFNSAAKRVKLTTIGFFQYIGPSVSLLLAIFVYNEPLTLKNFITFSLIWIALFLASLNTFKRKKYE